MGGCLGKKNKEAKVIQALKEGKKPIFWIFGGPGSGKGTQCEKLSKKYKLAHLSSGDLLRSEVASQSKFGKELNALMQAGQLVPMDIVLDLLKKAIINSYDSSNGFLIDGYPREVIQGKEFEEKIGPCAQIIFIETGDETMRSRLLKRGETSGRVDDNSEAIANRIKLFHDVSEPVILEYASITSRISGEQDAEDVFKNCCQQIEQYLNINK